ncbi:MAG: 2Fe-2S iron-sulfur cluster-binding protein [Vicinamibacterales bacterium]
MPVPFLALATTVHLALAALRNHRDPGTRPVSSLALVSLLLGALPWMFPSAAGLVAGLLVHVAWYVACERSRPTQPAGAVSSSPSARPQAPVRRKSAASASAVSASAVSKPRVKGFTQVPVLGVFDEGPDIRTFRLARPDGFDFEAGQFVAIRLRHDGRELVRCYSISSPPAATGYLEISVKRQGVVSNTLHALVRPGSLLAVRAPAGAFVYPAGDDRPLVLLAGGIGITPLISMLRHAALTEPSRPATLIYSARGEHDFAFRDELATLARRSHSLRVHFAASRGATRPDVYPGRIDEALITAAVPNIAHAIALLCGPQSMIDDVTALLRRLGVPAGQIRSELFEAAVAASVRTRSEEGVATPAAAAEAFQVRATRCGRTISVQGGQTLLDAAESHGVEIPSICRAGVCGTCRTKVVEGNVACTSDLLDEDDRAEGYVLACVAAVRGDCAIEA